MDAEKFSSWVGVEYSRLTTPHIPKIEEEKQQGGLEENSSTAAHPPNPLIVPYTFCICAAISGDRSNRWPATRQDLGTDVLFWSPMGLCSTAARNLLAKLAGLRQQQGKQRRNFSRREGEPQCWPLGEGGTLSHNPPQTTFRCSPESPRQGPLGIQELRQYCTGCDQAYCPCLLVMLKLLLISPRSHLATRSIAKKARLLTTVTDAYRSTRRLSSTSTQSCLGTAATLGLLEARLTTASTLFWTKSSPWSTKPSLKPLQASANSLTTGTAPWSLVIPWVAWWRATRCGQGRRYWGFNRWNKK